MYEKRFYRNLFKGNNLKFFNLCVFETDLSIGVSEEKCYDIGNKDNTSLEDSAIYKAALKSVRGHRNKIEEYIKRHPEFLTSLEPIVPDPDADLIVHKMCEAAKKAQVGPMAAVAGAIGEMVGYDVLNYCDEVIIENGGDIFIKTNSVRKIGIYAGKSPFNEKIALKITPEQTPAGVCTSSGTVGHSLSFGKADAAVIVSKNAFLADAVATAVGNKVKKPDDIESALKFASGIEGVNGAVIIIGDKIGAWGDIELTGF